jgi:hypothetical protein
MAVKKLSELTALTTAADGDLMLINDVSEASDADKPKKITAANLKSYMAADVIAAVGLLDGLGFSPQLRLSLTSGNPADSSDSGSVGTLYYTPYTGNAIQLYNGSNWEVFAISELSLSLTLTSGKNYDVFVDYNSGAPQLVLSSAWSNDTTRADALAYQNGRLIKSGTAAYLYVGTIRANGSNTTVDSAQYRYVFNHYNRIHKVCQIGSLTNAASGYAYFVIGDPNGASANCGMGGFYRASGANYADSYFYSSLIPSTPPGHFESGFRHYSTGNDLALWSSCTEMIHFPTGYGYIEMKPAVSGGTYSNGTIYADMEM